MTTRHILARDRRHAAIHEAGHCVIANWLGVYSYALIWPTGSDGRKVQTWLGQMSHHMTGIANNRLIGVAGAVAEVCWRYRRESKASRLDIVPQLMSPSDWRMTGSSECDDKLMRAMRRVYAKLNPQTGELWPEVYDAARGFIEKSRTISAEFAAECEASRIAGHDEVFYQWQQRNRRHLRRAA